MPQPILIARISHLSLIVACLSLELTVAVAPAAEPAPAEGKLSVGNRQYKLTQALAYEVKQDDVTSITVVLSDRRIPVDEIKRCLGENDGSDDSLSLTQPHVKLRYNAEGQIESISSWADNSSFFTSQGLEGQLEHDGDRVRGSVQLKPPDDPDEKFQRSCDARFDVVLGLAAASTKPAATGPVKPMVAGKFLGNRQPSKLAFVSARSIEPFNDKPAFELIFTERDHSQDKQAHINAAFGRFGSALIISLNDDGGVFGCQVVHTAMKKQGFSALGRMRTGEFELGEQSIQGQLTTDGEDEFFGETWEVDLRFAAPLAKSAKKIAKRAPAPRDDEPSDEPPPRPVAAGDAPKVAELKWPASATDFEYKKLVEQIKFKSATKHQALAREIQQSLKQQGWETDGSDLIAQASCILRRKKGPAELTIFVKPAASGSEVTAMTEGLDWNVVPK
ncbi:MAG: hypothetical protein K1X74_18055 [Pirellulales bacterium]|nr:hypothetical protein [Pirellulales bacterium]